MKDCVFSLHKGGHPCDPVLPQTHIQRKKRSQQRSSIKSNSNVYCRVFKKFREGSRCKMNSQTLKKLSVFNLSNLHFQQRVAVLDSLSLFHSQLPTKTSHAHPAILSWSYSLFLPGIFSISNINLLASQATHYFPPICGLKHTS